jgi:hypothetical protein
MPNRTKTLRKFLFQAGFISLLTLHFSCRHEMDNLETYKTVCFQTEVLPVFINSCSTTGCHSQSSGEGGRVFSDYTSIMKSITPKDPYNSEAYLAITGKKFTQMMPPHGVLTQDERMAIKMWIMQGAEQTTCSGANLLNKVKSKNDFWDNYDNVKAYVCNGLNNKLDYAMADTKIQQLSFGHSLTDYPVKHDNCPITQGTPQN